MQAALFNGPENIEIVGLPLKSLNSDELLIKVEACGVCGTDFHIFEGKAPAKPPVILGHEYAGEIIEYGSEVKDFNIGERVAINPNIHCGYCEFCRSGKINLCKNLKALGVTINGGFSEYSVVPHTQAYKLPDKFPYNIAAFAEPLSCCIHGINQADIKIGNTVAIIGAGPIGLLIIQLARLKGASKILSIDPVKNKRDSALKLNADYAIDPGESAFIQNIYDITDGGCDIVIECAGNSSAVESALNIVKKGGTVVVFGLPDGSAFINLSLQKFFHKELTIKSSLLNPFTFGTAVDLLTSKKINVETFTTSPVHLRQESIYNLFNTPRDPEITKYIVTPNN